MPGASVVRQWWWIAIAAALGACRGHEPLCESDACSAALQSDAGAAGLAAAGDEGGRGGEGGDGAQPAKSECQRDSQCQNGSACDGDEHCEGGHCLAGEVIQCRVGMVCSEAAAGSCLFAEPSPWLVVVGARKVEGLPMARVVAGDDLLPLAERDATGELTGFDQVFWSPDGKVALLHAVEDQLGSSVKLLRFGAGLPTQPRPVPDVPTWGDYYDKPVFSADSSRVELHDNFPGRYLVDLHDDPEPTRLVTEEPPDELAVDDVCVDSDSWLQTDEDGVHFLATRAAGKVSQRELGPGTITLSSDGRFVTRVDTDAEPSEGWLYPCSPDDWGVPFQGVVEATFSANSKRLAFDRQGGGVRVVSLEQPREPADIWTSSTGEALVFTPDSNRLLTLLSEPDKEPSLHEVDFSTPGKVNVHWLQLPSSSSIAEVGNAALLVWAAKSPDEPTQLWWQRFGPTQAPVLVDASLLESDTSLRGVPFVSGSVLIQQRVMNETALSMLAFDGELSDAIPLASLPNEVAEAVPWAEGRGFVLTMSEGLFDTNTWWLQLPGGKHPVGARKLFDGSLQASIQPWP